MLQSVKQNVHDHIFEDGQHGASSEQFYGFPGVQPFAEGPIHFRDDHTL